MPNLSVIIPTCNRNEMLGLCLERLAPGRQTLPASDYEVIVTDDSTGEGAELFCNVYFPFVRYNCGSGKGPAANRNSGAKLAAGKWLVFTDDDCLPEAGWLKAYSNAIEMYPDSKAFEGAILPDDLNLLKKDMAECPVNTNGNCFWSANIMVEKLLFETIGGFDEQFKLAAHEDQDLYNRLMPITRVVFVVRSKVFHPVRFLSLRKKIKGLPLAIKNFRKLINKQSPEMQVILLSKSRKNHFISIWQNIKRGRLKSATYHFFALIYYLSN